MLSDTRIDLGCGIVIEINQGKFCELVMGSRSEPRAISTGSGWTGGFERSQAAIDRKGLPGDPVILWIDQKMDRPSYIPRLAKSTRRVHSERHLGAAGLFQTRWVSGVWTSPGATALTRIRFEA